MPAAMAGASADDGKISALGKALGTNDPSDEREGGASKPVRNARALRECKDDRTEVSKLRSHRRPSRQSTTLAEPRQCGVRYCRSATPPAIGLIDTSHRAALSDPHRF